MIYLIGYLENNETKELIYKLAKKVAAPTVCLFAKTSKLSTETFRDATGIICFGEKAAKRVKELVAGQVPIMQVPETKQLSELDPDKKVEVWNTIKNFVVNTSESKENKVFISSADTIIEISDDGDITWPELQMITKLCDYLGEQKFSITVEKKEKEDD